ncbi:unnamed protein product [Vicia faba]|uniref:Uncharacterized protein n=1 Tax=Vicia faba TaxID=3906 RepID=A0AAV1AA26_VICFA|nr:unnamed protein product [Vicia faba]
MITLRLQLPLFIFLLQFASFSNASSSPHSNLTHIFHDILKAISAKQNWDLNDVTIFNFDLAKIRFGTSQNYDFRIGSGPFELRVDEIHHLSLSLPMNVSLTGLKRIIVGEGITVEVKRAREISFYYRSDLDLQMNASVLRSKGKIEFWPFLQSTCVPLIPLGVKGSASLVAYGTRNPNAHIGTRLISEDTVELLPEKCYHGSVFRTRACPVASSSLRLSMLEKILKSLLGHKILQDRFSGLIKANIKACAAVKFPLELERDIGKNATLSTLPDWRTRPSVERVWFEILARVEENRLKPLSIKKVKPFIESNSISWANLVSNMSYTKLRPVLLPPEALTLDVKW